MSLGRATKPRWTKVLRAWLSVAVTAGLLAWVAQRVDVGEIRASLTAGNPLWWGAAVCLVPFQVLLGALRWHRVAERLALPMPLGHAVNEYGLGIVLNQILPGGVAGDAVRVWRHKQGHGELAAPLRAALVDRVIGHWAHLLVTFAGLVAWFKVHGEHPPTGSMTVLLCLGAFFAIVWWKPPPGFRGLVGDTRVALGRGTEWAFHGAVSVTLVGTFLLSFWLCATALGLPLGLAAFTAVPLLMLITVIPVSIGGWGLRELSAVVILASLGWSASDAVALSAAYGLANLVGAVPFLLVLGKSG